MEHFFSPKSIVHLRLDAHNSQIIGGDAGVDHTQTIGGGYSKIIGGIYPPILPGFRHPCSLYYVEVRDEFARIFPRHCTRAAQLLSKKCCSGSEPFNRY